MCGVVGYIGQSKALPKLIEGLSKLEYRGYDSAGVALLEKDGLKVEKTKGRLLDLEKKVHYDSSDAVVGIGHTRWATHGEPTTFNAHPHMNMKENIAVIHNGIIENYLELKEWLVTENDIVFKSQTDTEVIAHLIDYYYHGNLLEAVNHAVDRMEGAYAIGVICKDEPDKIIAVRKDSPLVVGLEKGGNYIASDIPALLKYTKDVLLIENDETVVLTADNVTILDHLGQEVTREIYHVEWDAEAAEKEGFEHFTIKEIHEQPRGVEKTISRRLIEDEINLDGITFTKEDLKDISKVYIVACGTAYHAGLIGKYAIEKFANIPVEVDIASEFRYRDPFIDDNTLFIAVSQSGETLDTLQSLRLAKEKGARIMSVVNVVGSSVARESDDVFYTWAGPEIGVASTKAYTTQLTGFYLIALYMGKVMGYLTDDKYHELLEELKQMPSYIQHLLDNAEKCQKLADQQFNNENIFFMGRGLDVYIAQEASLKLKEISYINSFSIAAGELKHGTIALIEEGTLVVSVATQTHLFDKMLSNMEEVKARGAYVLAIAQENNKMVEQVADEVIYIPETYDELTAISSIVPLQLFAYYVSLARGNDVDKPRNLAKSVTVE